MQMEMLVTLESCSSGLVGDGFFITNKPAQTGAAAILAQGSRVFTSANLKMAAVGRNRDERVETNIRSDRIKWLELGAAPILDDYLHSMDQLRQALNSNLYLGLFDYECHFAHYPVGAFYKKHLDAFADQNPEKGNRKLSTILYLNEDWQPGDGGELVIYKPGSDEELVRVEPRLGTLVMFLSEEFPHEVLPTNKPRWSLTGWFRTRAS